MKTSDMFKEAFEYTKKPWFQWTLVIIFLLIIITTSSTIRTSNIHLLTDQTTGEYIPVALDPFYFMRQAQTIQETGANFPATDDMRIYPGFEAEWNAEIMPFVVVEMYNFATIINPSYSLEYIMIISPVIFYILGLILFFFICLSIGKNKWLAVLASAFLAYTPAYLYRTMAGFADHESIGMMGFFIALLIFSLAIKSIGKDKKQKTITGLYWGVGVGVGTAISITSWVGAAKFLTIIIPITMILLWLYYTKTEKMMHKILLLHSSWIVTTYVTGVYLLGFSQSKMEAFFTGSTGIISIAMLGLMTIDYIVRKINHKKINKQYRIMYSLGITIILGSIAMFIIGRNPFDLLWAVALQLINPFGIGRIGSTVAENRAPYLGEWISQTGSNLFWMFFFGMVMFGYQLSRRVETNKAKVQFFGLFIAMISGILFSKYSASSILNGDSFISILVYFIPLFFFIGYFLKFYIHNNLKWTRVECFIFAWLLFTLVSGRAAARVFFAITPFVCFMAAYLVVNLYTEWKKNSDKLMKVIFACFLIITLLLSYTIIIGSYNGIKGQAQFTGPSANAHWQDAMKWVRENTAEDATFNHWWDYGYWVQSLGERRTVSDGGHFQNAIGGDHKMGRYVLTTPHPETALSFFKTMEVDYLLIDPTDFGKYSAYSKIGSDDDWDRFSIIPLGITDQRNIQETNNETISVYTNPNPNQAFGVVDEDIMYDRDGDGEIEIFLPGPTYDANGNPSYKSYLAAVQIKRMNNGLIQAEGIYVYNNIQHTIPIRYLYINGELIDFTFGLDAVISIIPRLETSSIDPNGAMIYLSPRVSKSLFAQLYLLDDSFENYPTITVAHDEYDPVVKSLRAQGFNQSAIVYYQGLRGPIRIFDTQEIPDEINIVPNFYFPHSENDFAALDNEEFIQ